MISLSYSEFLVECDDDYKHHVFVRSNQGYDEITNKDYNKDALINDIVYDVSELVKERDKKQGSVLEQIRAEIEQLRLHKSQFITSDNKVCIDSQDVLNIIDKYINKSEK